MTSFIALLSDTECRLQFLHTVFHFRVTHYFVQLADDVILFVKSKESIPYFQREISSKKFSLTEMPS